MDTNVQRFTLPPITVEDSFAAIDKTKVDSLGDIFLWFITPEVLAEAWTSFPEEYWMYGSGRSSGTFCGGKVSLKFLYAYLAVYILIVGEQNGPKESQGEKRPLRRAIETAVDYLSKEFPMAQVPSASILDRFWGRFYFPRQVWPRICQNFCSLLKRPGRCLAGDEKLLKFTGNSGYIRLVPSKPDRIGLWFFELVAILNNGDPYMVHTMMSTSNPSTGDTVPVNAVVKEWASVVNYFVETKNSIPPILTFDSYYTDGEGRKFLNEKNVKFIGAVNTARFRNLVDQLAEHGAHVDKPGQTASIYNPNSNEIFVHHWDLDHNVGKKYVLSNAFNPVPATRSNAGIVPAYDQYKVMFNGCDKYNRNFNHRKYCHRAGGGGRSGENGHTFKFLMACILQNTFNAFRSAHDDTSLNLTFRQMCHILSRFLIRHSSTLP